MKRAELDRYCGMRWRREFDCADFVELVQRELYGRFIRIPNGRPRGPDAPASLASLSSEFVRPTDKPQDGDFVLMFDGAQQVPGHCGLYFHVAHEGYVLHCNEKTGSVMHPVRDLPSFGLRIERVYAWV